MFVVISPPAVESKLYRAHASDLRDFVIRWMPPIIQECMKIFTETQGENSLLGASVFFTSLWS